MARRTAFAICGSRTPLTITGDSAHGKTVKIRRRRATVRRDLRPTRDATKFPARATVPESESP